MRRKSKLERRVADLEREVEALKARPPVEYHYHYSQPTYVPPPYPNPYPVWQPWIAPTITCAGAVDTSIGIVGFAHGGSITPCH